MTVWLAGMRVTKERLADYSVVTQTVGVVAATGWTISSFSGRKSKGMCTVLVTATRSGASISELATNSGNIPDTDVCTLPVGWHPPERVGGIWAHNNNDGEASCSSAGLIEVRTTSGSAAIANGNTIRIYFTWFCGDPN